MFTIENAQALLKGLATLKPIDHLEESRAHKTAALKDYHRMHPDEPITPELAKYFDPSERKQFRIAPAEQTTTPAKQTSKHTSAQTIAQTSKQTAPDLKSLIRAPIPESALNASTIAFNAALFAFEQGARILNGTPYHRDNNGTLATRDTITSHLCEYTATIETKRGTKTITQATHTQLWREAKPLYIHELKRLSNECTLIDTIRFNGQFYQSQNAAPFRPTGVQTACTLPLRNIPTQPSQDAFTAYQLYKTAISTIIQNGAELFQRMLTLTGLTLIGIRLNARPIRRHICIYGRTKGTGKTSFTRLLEALGLTFKQYDASTPKDNFTADGIENASLILFDDFYRPKDQRNIIQSLVNSQRITINPKGKRAYEIHKLATIITTQNEPLTCYEPSGLYAEKCIYWKFDPSPTALDNGELKTTAAQQLATAIAAITEHPEQFALEALKAISFITKHNTINAHFKRPNYTAQLIDDLLKLQNDESDEKPAAPIGTPEHFSQYCTDHAPNANDTQGLLEQYLRDIVNAHGFNAPAILKDIRPSHYLRIAAEYGNGAYIPCRQFDLRPYVHISKQSASKQLNRAITTLDAFPPSASNVLV